MTRRTAWALGFVALLLVSALASAKSVSIEDFFREFTDDWMRANPTLATMNLYFTGAEQDRLDRQITSQSLTAKRARTALARRALATLATYPRETLTAEQRLSADVMQWQLQMLVDREPYLDYSYPLNQFQGANMMLVRDLTQFHRSRRSATAKTTWPRWRRLHRSWIRRSPMRARSSNAVWCHRASSSTRPSRS